MSTLDNLIELSQGAYEDTFKWERSTRRMGVVNRVMLVAMVALFFWDLFLLFAELSWVRVALTVVALLLVAVYVWLIEHNKNHLAWILHARARWEADLRHWQAVKMEVEETGSYPSWAYKTPPDL